MTNDYLISRFEGAVKFLPYSMRERIRGIKPSQKAVCEEFRLRVGRPVSVLMPDGEFSLGGDFVTKKDIELLLELATEASVYSNKDQLKEGFITAKGGYRIGLCGTTSRTGGDINGFTALSSANIRISREIQGAADSLIEPLTTEGFRSTLIVSPPGAGKTTLLRDIVRTLSDGTDLLRGSRVALADERGEIAALYDGIPQMHIGSRTDVLDDCPKSKAVIMLLRSMNPEIIALDEITAAADADAVISASHCGVEILATAHASHPEELYRKSLYRKLLDEKIFYNFIFIECKGKKRIYILKNAGEIEAEFNTEGTNA